MQLEQGQVLELFLVDCFDGQLIWKGVQADFLLHQ